MCESLKSLIETDLKPFLQSRVTECLQNGDAERAEEIEHFLRSLDEMEEDMESGAMDSWECGELYEEFKRLRESGEFLDKIC